MPKHLIMGTAGHVDHGKTALIKALTGTDCDTHKEEKQRGITINLGFAFLELSEQISIGIVDVPGHKDFIKTMVAGAHGIDFVLLVIAADSGIMPQTREHFNILRMLGVKHGLVVLNKSDLVDEETLELAKLEVLEFLEDSPFEEAPVVAVSSHTGTGIIELKETLLKIAENIPEKNHDAPFRMFIDRIFNVRGKGIVVTGSVLEGRLSIGEELFLLPGNHGKLKVKAIERHGRSVDGVAAGDRAALNLSGLKYDDFERGMLLATKMTDQTQLIDVQVELFPGILRIGVWSHQILHTGTFTSKVRMHLITKDELIGGERAVAQIHLEKPAILHKNDRFVLRNTSNDMTIGGGMILDAAPLHHRRRTEKLKSTLKELATAMNDRENLEGLIRFELQKANTPLSVADLALRTGLTEAMIEDAIAGKSVPGMLLIFEDKKHIVPEAISSRMTEAVLTNLAAWHSQNPLMESGMDIREIAGKLKVSKGFDFYLLEQLLLRMTSQGSIRKSGNTFVLKNHKVKIDRNMQEQLNWLEATLEKSGLHRTALNEIESLALQQNIRKGQLIMLLKYLAATGKAHFTGEDALHSGVVDKARQKVLKKLAESPRGINEKELRLLIDSTKKATQILINIFVDEGVMEKQTFYLHITSKGQRFLASGQ